MSRRKSGADKASPAAARKPRKQADPRRPRRGPGDSTESPGGANECEKSVETGSPQTIPGRNDGTLTPFQPGMSGNPHRGPDLHLRVNAVRGVFLEALAREAPKASDWSKNGRGRARSSASRSRLGGASAGGTGIGPSEWERCDR